LRTSKWSYHKLRGVSIAIARQLGQRGVGRGDRVLLIAENSPEWVAAFFGCLLRGAIVVPLDIEGGLEFAGRVQAQVEAKLMLLGTTGEPPDANVPSARLEELANSARGREVRTFTPVTATRGDIAEIIFTSGTTADPKGVCITHGNILANIDPVERHMQPYLRWEKIVHPIRFLNLLPYSHVFGQFMGIFVPQLIGGEIFLLDSFNPGEIIDVVKKQRISAIVSVPRVLDSLKWNVERSYAERGRAESFEQRVSRAEKAGTLRRWWTFRRVHRRFGWKFWAFVSGGAALPSATETFWRRLGFAVIQGYGMTETASLVTVNHPFKVGRGSIGKALPGQELKLDEHGQILVRGPNVSPGYWKAGPQPLVTQDGWLQTGDVAEIDSEGNVYFKSRSKDVIVTASGVNIYPEDLETALKDEPEVKDAAVLTIEGARGPEPFAVLLLREVNSPPEEIVRRANAALNAYQQIRQWSVWPEPDFPRTATQKIRKPLLLDAIRKQMRRRSTNGQVVLSDERQAGGGTPWSFVLQEAGRITGHLPTAASAFATLGGDLKLDSLGRVELLAALEDRYQIDIDESLFTETTTLGDIERLIRGASTAKVNSGTPVAIGPTPFPLETVAAAVAAPRIPEAKAPSDMRSYPRWQLSWPVRMIRIAVLYLIILPLTRLMSRAGIEGGEHVNKLDGPALVISNHVAMVDQALVLLALPARLRNNLAIAMEGERLWGWRHPRPGTSLFTRMLGYAKYLLVVALFNVFPLAQKSGYRRSFAHAGECVDDGCSVLVFPEGRRSQTGEMNRFMDGIGVLAAGLRVPVIPIRLDGLYELKARRKSFAKKGQVTVKVGEPVLLDSAEPGDIARDLETRVRSL